MRKEDETQSGMPYPTLFSQHVDPMSRSSRLLHWIENDRKGFLALRALEVLSDPESAEAVANF